MLNIDLSDEQWFQARLPVKNDGLRIRSAQMLAPSAFSASAASTSTLQESILPATVKYLVDKSVTEIELRWTALAEVEKSIM